jgi:CBS domain-containing protein
MGSEGRGEQIVKSDQDNALLLRDECTFPDLESVAATFNNALIRMGYPPCPGNVMLTNPLWRQPLGRFKETLRRWVFGASPEGMMNLAIFLDARAVAGDVDLLLQARRFLRDCVVDNDAFFARFAAAAVQLGGDGSWWNRFVQGRAFEPGTFDLKKSGTFPIVHGVRALALQHHIDALDTAERLQALSQAGVLADTVARDLTDALRFLMAVKARTNLRQRALSLPVENRVRLADLSTLERDTLRGSASIVGSFRRHLHRHYRLDAL